MNYISYIANKENQGIGGVFVFDTDTHTNINGENLVKQMSLTPNSIKF